MESLGVKWFLSPSVPAAAARRVDRLELLQEFQVEHCVEASSGAIYVDGRP
jgi:hypothetical protein